MKHQWVSLLFLLTTLSIGVSGCRSFPIHYLWQAGQGQFSLMWNARSLSEVLRDERISLEIKNLLKEVQPIKNFAIQKGLSATKQYETYVALDRPSVVWVVSACQPLEFVAKKWSFPLVGSFPYLGWFDLQAARGYAAQLEKEGWETDVRGVAAYSTLNWFEDPLLSSMFSHPHSPSALVDLMNLIFHESVHATFSLPNETSLNESLADFIADRLTEAYLDREGAFELKKTYFENRARFEEWKKKLHDAYQQLDAVYRSSQLSKEEKQKRKEEVFELLKKKTIEKKMNNASLMQFKVYHSFAEPLQALWEEEGRDVKKMLERLKKMSLEEIHSQFSSVSGL